MAEERKPLQREMQAHGFNIFDEALSIEAGGVAHERGPARASLVVEDERVPAGQRPRSAAM